MSLKYCGRGVHDAWVRQGPSEAASLLRKDINDCGARKDAQGLLRLATEAGDAAFDHVCVAMWLNRYVWGVGGVQLCR